MNTDERNTDARGQVNSEGFKPQQSAGVETRLSDTASDLQTIRAFFGMSTNRMQDIWDICRGDDRGFYRQKIALIAETARMMRHRTNGRAS